jgi:hypothetical protein
MGHTQLMLSLASRITVTVHSMSRAAPARQLHRRLRASRVHPTDLRVKSNFLSRIKLFLPVQSHPKKYSGFPKSQITL